MEQNMDTQMSPVIGIIYLAIIIVTIVSLWKVFTKAGQPGWAAIIPFYNAFIMIKVAGKPAWWFILLFVPVANLVISILVFNGIAVKFGKGIGYTIGLFLLPFVFLPMLAFSDAQYSG